MNSTSTSLKDRWTARGDDAAARRTAADARYWEAPGRWRGDSPPPAGPTQPSPVQPPPASGPPRRRFWFVILPVGLIVWAISAMLGGHNAAAPSTYTTHSTVNGVTTTCTVTGAGTSDPAENCTTTGGGS
jgi:hypothetical protein